MSSFAQEVLPLLQTRRFGHTIRTHESLASTNTTAMEWAHDGAAEGSIVYADFQSAGRGRQGRTWTSSAGQNLLFSIILRPRLPLTKLNLITLAASIAVADAIDAIVSPLRTAIKWPNDILVEGVKCCGMLLESSFAGAIPEAVVLGIGLNVNQRDFPDELELTATSLLLQTGQHISRPALLASVLANIEKHYHMLFDNEEGIRQIYTERLHGMGHTVTVQGDPNAHPIVGTIMGITPTGSLRLLSPKGIHVCHVGDMT